MTSRVVPGTPSTQASFVLPGSLPSSSLLLQGNTATEPTVQHPLGMGTTGSSGKQPWPLEGSGTTVGWGMCLVHPEAYSPREGCTKPPTPECGLRFSLAEPVSLSLQGRLPVQRRHSSSGCVLGTRLELVRWIFSALCGFQCVRKTNWETAARLVRMCGPLPVAPPVVEKVPACVWTPPPWFLRVCGPLLRGSFLVCRPLPRSSRSGKGSCVCVDPSPAVPSSNSGEKLCLVPDSGGSLDRGNTSRPHKP